MKWRVKLFSLLALVAGLGYGSVVLAVTGVQITAATGGGAISADTNGATGSGAYTTLTGPVLTELNPGGVATTGTIILNIPAGFAFDTGTNVTATVTAAAGKTCTAAAGLLLGAGSFTQTVTPTTTTITINVFRKSSPPNQCVITYTNIRVRPTAGSPLASGNITRTGTASITENPATTNYGTLTEVIGAAAKLAFVQQPSNTVAGATITPAVTVAIQDLSGNTVTSNISTVTLAIGTNPGGGTLSGTTAVAAVAGVATFSTLSINLVGTGYTLAASDGALTGVTSSAFNITTGVVSATVSTVAASPTSVAADGVTTSTITVTLKDGASNPVAGKTVTLAAGSGSSTITTVSGTTNASGVATFTVKDSVAESVTYTATDTTDTITITQTATVTFTVALDHIQLEDSGTGLTCQPSSVTIKACTDAGCTSLSTVSVTVTLSTTAGTWSTNPITFTGSTSVNLSVTLAQTVTIGTSSVSPAPISSTICLVGATQNCQIVFADTGFIFSTIPNQVAGVASGNLTIQAVQKAGNSPNCVNVFQNKTVAIDLASQCIDPTTCIAGKQIAITTTTPVATTSIANNPASGITTYTSVNMGFNNTSTATFTLAYFDVGKMSLSARYALGGGNYMTGTSNTFVVKPFGFTLTGIKRTSDNFANPAAADATGTAFITAGGSFTATATAIANGGAATPNYGLEVSSESVKLTPTLAPGLGLTNNPAIGGSFGAFSGGVATGTAFTWKEAGIITLTPSVGDADYLGAGDVTGTTSGNVGRFYASQFALSGGSIANRTGLAGCAAPAGCGAFTYMGEQMSAVFNLTAKATDGTTTLQNYNYSATAANNFAKLDPTAAGNPLVLGAVDTGAPRTVATLDTTTYGVASGNFASGVASVTAPFAVIRGASPSGPFDALAVGIVPTDSDGATMGVLDLAVNASGAPNTHGQVGSTKARYGRIRISNAHGSELLQLPIGVAVQYWNGTNYVTSTTDSVTTLANANVALANWQKLTPASSWTTGSTSVVSPPATVVFTNGVGSFTLSTPGSGKTGSVDITTTAPAYLPSNTGRATFGVYKGGNEFIYLRENY